MRGTNAAQQPSRAPRFLVLLHTQRRLELWENLQQPWPLIHKDFMGNKEPKYSEKLDFCTETGIGM